MIRRARAGIALSVIGLGMLAATSPYRAAAAPNDPFLFSYAFNNRLALGGGITRWADACWSWSG